MGRTSLEPSGSGTSLALNGHNDTHSERNQVNLWSPRWLVSWRSLGEVQKIWEKSPQPHLECAKPGWKGCSLCFYVKLNPSPTVDRAPKRLWILITWENYSEPLISVEDEDEEEEEDVFTHLLWRQVQHMSDLFCKRWVKEYLTKLQECWDGYWVPVLPSTEVPSGVPISFRTNGTTIDIFVILSPSPPTVLKTNWKLFLLCLPYLHTTLARVAAHIQNTGGMSRNILTKNKRSTFFYPTKYSDSFIFWIDHCFLMKQWLCRQKTLVTQSGETVGFD